MDFNAYISAIVIFGLGIVEFLVIFFIFKIKLQKSSQRVLHLEDEMVYNHREILSNLKRINELEAENALLHKKIATQHISPSNKLSKVSDVA